MPRKLNTNHESNERNGEQVFNFEDLYKLKLKSIVLSSTHSFRTLAFLLAPLLLSRTFTHAAIRSVSTMKKADLAAPFKKLTIHIPSILVGRTTESLVIKCR